MIPFSTADMIVLFGVVVAIWTFAAIIETREERRFFREQGEKTRREIDEL